MFRPYRLFLSPAHYDRLLAHARTALPNECCGLLAGSLEETPGGPVGLVRWWHALGNVLASPTEFESEPKSMFRAERDIQTRGLQVLAVYHSHPTSAPVPSKKDLARNYSQEVMNLILSLQGNQPELRAWWLTETAYSEGSWEMWDDPSPGMADS